MNVGELIHDVTIQQGVEAVDSTGFPSTTWSTLCQAWMSRDTVSGLERFKSDQLSAASVLRWEMRYRADMDPDLIDVPKTRRLLYKGRSIDITAAEAIDRQEGVALITLAKVG